jgi:hypothetical protein
MFPLPKTIFRLPLFALLLFCACAANGATFTVTNLSDGGAGSLRQAIIDANNAAGDDVINFQPNLTGAVLLTSGELSVTGNIAVNGAGASVLSVQRDGAAAASYFRIFNIAAQTNVSINNISVKGGVLNSNAFLGAGIYNAGALQLNNVVVANNVGGVTPEPLPGFSVYQGGGIYNTGQLIVTGSTITGNQVGGGGSSGMSGYGAGIANSNTGTMTVRDTNITGNKAFGGGGLSRPGMAKGVGISNDGVAVIERCFIYNNQGDARNSTGGGIYNDGTLSVSNTTISNNRAFGSTQNGAGAGGGIASGIFSDAATINVSSTTITLNSIAGLLNAATVFPTIGGGIYSKIDNSASLTNTIVADNITPNGSNITGVYNSGGGNLIGHTNSSSGWIAADVLNQNPQLGQLGDYGGATQTFALLPDSPAINAGVNAAAAPTDQRGAPRIIGGRIDSGAFEYSHALFDFDGDKKTDLSIFRPSAGEWWINRSSNAAAYALQFGSSSDKITPADFTGDGKTDVAFFRPASGEWFVLRSEDNSFYSYPFGASGDIPFVGYFDADFKADSGVFRPSTATWYIRQSSDGAARIEQFGQNGDVPVVADYDNDGESDIAVYRPLAGEWWIQRSAAGLIAYRFGTSVERPVPGDYTGDGKADVATFRPASGEWVILRSENQSYYIFPFGAGGDIPSPADYDGDGKFDAAIFRPSSATWYVDKSTGGNLIQQFGQNGDKPAPNAFVPEINQIIFQ